MVRVGKWRDKGVSFAAHLALPRGGRASMNKKVWWGTITKRTAQGDTCTILFRSATYGYFDAIEFSIIYSTQLVGNDADDSMGTVLINTFNGASLFLGASLGVATPEYVWVEVWGR